MVVESIGEEVVDDIILNKVFRDDLLKWYLSRNYIEILFGNDLSSIGVLVLGLSVGFRMDGVVGFFRFSFIDIIVVLWRRTVKYIVWEKIKRLGVGVNLDLGWICKDLVLYE